MEFYKSYRKYLYKRDTLLATLSVFVLIGLLALLPLNTKIFNPIKTALADFDFLDLTYAKLGKNEQTPFDNRILVVNISNSGRAEIAGLIQTVAAGKPSAIGLDVVFEKQQDPETDAYLRQTLEETPNLVVASRINWNQKDNLVERGFFKNNRNAYGYANFIGEDRGTIRYFSPAERQAGNEYLSFTTALLKTAHPEKYEQMVRRNKEVELINYRRRENQYLIVNSADILEGSVADSIFHNKIVLLGYISSSESDIEDKHFTPMNRQFAGKSVPDMNGVIIHANILSMLLDNRFIRTLPGWLNWAFTILIAWLHVALFVRYYIDDHIWFHLVAKMAQIISAIFFVYLSVMVFYYFSLKIDMKMPIIVIVLAIDVIYFYEAFALWLNKRYGFHTLFHHNSH